MCSDAGRLSVLRLRLTVLRWNRILSWPSYCMRVRPKRRRTPDAYTVVPYNPSWPRSFDAIRDRLAPVLRDISARIEHIGSTAVPGLAAKPIIDVDVVVGVNAEVATVIERLERIGYIHEGDLGVPGREALAEGEGPSALAYHHLYVVVNGTKAHQDHVLFRDFLRTHREAATAYGTRKLELAHLLTPDASDEYLRGKADLVERILEDSRRS